MTKLYPGVEGIGSGVGFSVDGTELNLAVMHRYQKRGVFEKLRPLWKDFFESAGTLTRSAPSTMMANIFGCA